MGKLEKIASEWVANGLCSDIDEAEAKINQVLADYASDQLYRARLKEDIRIGLEQIRRGEGTVYASVDEAFADILGEDWVEKDS